MTQNVVDPFEVSEEAANRLNQGMNLGGGIELPFDAPVFWWMNCNTMAQIVKQQQPALYYGGWASEHGDIESVSSERGSVPGGLILADVPTKKGTVQAYTARYLVIAPIGFRACWVVKGDNGTQKRAIQYIPGGRQHIQLIALLGLKQSDGSYISWGPVMLTAKGYQVGYLQSALKDWKKTLERPRREFAPNVPAWAFWVAIGTFTKEPVSQMVGKSAQSPITPINLHIPGNIDRDMLAKLYAGRKAVDEMAALLTDAGEWLGAWKQHNQEIQSVNGEGSDDDWMTDENAAMGEEIPF